ncbi:MAG: AAA family ATPase, partial [Pseudomonadota bacterium]
PINIATGTSPGRSLVRIPLDLMETLGLVAGDTVAIGGTQTTHARAIPAPRGAEGIAAPAEMLDLLGVDAMDMVALSPAALPPLNMALVKLLDDAQATPADLADGLFDLPLTEGDICGLTLPGGRAARVEVIALDPTPAGLLTDTTSLSLQAAPAGATYTEIGGLDDQIKRVHEMVATPLLRPELFERLGVPAPRGVLFTGPPGSGKTLLARSVAATTSAAFFQINGPEIVSKHYGESEAALRKLFAAAEKDAPAIIFIDEIDAIAPRREGLSGEKQVERRVVAQLLTLLDGLSDRGRVILMAATNLPDSLDPALRRPGRFDREIAFTPPKPEQRADILGIHLRAAPLGQDVELRQIADAAHGYVGADLAALAREASLACLDRTVRAAGGEDRVNPADLHLSQADLRHGLAATSPSALRDTVVESPRASFSDIGGMAEAKAALQEAVIWPQQHKDRFASLGLSPLAGVLLSGPPGSGKTLLARALASEAAMNFIPVRPARILSQFLGDAERAIAELFAKARQSAPCIVFFDELDALAPRRSGKDAALDRIVAQMLVEMDGMARNPGVVVLAATNRAAAIDPALLRAGRFDLTIPVPLPDTTTRADILAVHTKSLPLAADVDLSSLAQMTAGASGADLAVLVQTAARTALRRSLQEDADPTILAGDFQTALSAMTATAAAQTDDFIKGGAAA